MDDILGKYGEFKPKFARRYTDLGETIREAAKHYVNDVEQGLFPADEEVFKLDDEQRAKLQFLYSKQD